MSLIRTGMKFQSRKRKATAIISPIPRARPRTMGILAFTRKRNLGARRLNARTGGFLGIESKFLDCAWNAVGISSSADGSGGEVQPSTGCTQCISCPAQGDGESQRDGRKFVLKSAFVSGIIQTAATGDLPDAFALDGYFIALVLDKQANGATITSEDVFINPSTQARAMMPQPLRNLQHSKRFRILDSMYIRPGGAYGVQDSLLAATASINHQTVPTFKLSWRGNITVNTTGTTADVASVSDNALHVICYSGGATITPTLVAKSRVRFMG